MNRSSGLSRRESIPIGILANVEYEEGAVELQPGELILVYSDGLTEATNEAGEEFGVPRLEALLPQFRGRGPEEMGATVLAAVDRYMGNVRPNDDLSIAIIVRRWQLGGPRSKASLTPDTCASCPNG